MVNAKKLLALLLVASLVLGEVFRISLDFLGLKSAVVSITDILALMFVFWGISFSKKKFFKAKLARPIFMYTSVGLLSLVVNSPNLLFSELFVSSLYLLRWILFAGVYLVIREFDPKTKRTFSFALIFTSLAVALLGFIQYFLYPDLRNIYYAGWDEHLYRLFSTFLDPNFAGAILVLGFILSLGLMLEEKGATKFKLMICAISILTAVLLTYSRSAFLMFAGSTITLLIFAKKKKLLLTILILAIVGILILPKDLKSEGVNLFRTASISARGDSMKNALTIFKNNPIFGVGFDSYRYAQIRYGFIKQENLHSGAGTDNSFLFVLATTGLIGFTSFMYLWYRILQTAVCKLRLQIANSDQNIISYIVIASVVGLFVDSLFINSLFYEKIMLWMWVLVGVMENK